MNRNSEIQKKYVESLLSKGGSRLSCINLNPEATKALEKLVESGESKTKVINRLLISQSVMQ